MLKIIGAVFIVAAGSLFGLRASQRLHLRYKKLLKHSLFIDEVSDMMRIGVELSQIYALPSAEELLTAEGYTVTLKKEELGAEDIRLLEEFYSSLGMSDTEAGIQRCAAYGKIVAKRLEAAEQDMKSRSRLYSLLGVFSGIFVAILLM